jgi:hypothetical protein
MSEIFEDSEKYLIDEAIQAFEDHNYTKCKRIFEKYPGNYLKIFLT